ncbi:hypothetical protein [Nitrosomonas ureae]|uniref:hypothetical protein n=1 Tax=Nitrosomonas ureae TaxID=44577 RepID=UPI0011B00AF7|nr:hypothetical protein [Nitrosomonas ureae]
MSHHRTSRHISLNIDAARSVSSIWSGKQYRDRFNRQPSKLRYYHHLVTMPALGIPGAPIAAPALQARNPAMRRLIIPDRIWLFSGIACMD